MPIPSHPVRVTYTCRRCTSAQVTRDARVEWSVLRQRWEIASLFDTAWCHTCNAATKLIEREIDPEPPTSRP